MKVLLLTPGAYGVNGGIGLYNRDIIEALCDMEAVQSVTVVMREIQRPFGGLPAKVRWLEGAASGKIRFSLVALAEAAKGCDLLVCGHINLMPLAALIKRLTRRPMVLMVYGIDVWQRPTGAAARHVEAADAIWSISQVTTDRMNEWARLPKNRYTLVPNAIHLERYSMASEPSPVRLRFGLEKKTVLMTLTRLPGFDRYKGVDEVLECLGAIASEVPDVAYLVAGDGEDRPRLEAKVRDLGLTDRVVFAGFVPEADKADFYRAADLFVLPGRGEGFGFVFLEALACGVPCVGSSIDGSREALREGMLGILVDPRDLETVRDGILDGLKQPRGIPDGLAYFALPAFNARVAAATDQLVTRVHA